eukprot:jgi/Psemu1/216806/e_gw1.817.2.1
MATEKGSIGYSYGAVSSNDEESGGDGKNRGFDESNLYYYKDQELTSREKISKMIKLLVPLIIATGLIGGLAYILFHDFGGLYPAPGEEKTRMNGGSVSQPSETDSMPSVPTYTKTSSFSSSSTPAIAKSDTSAGSSCAANPSCVALGLTGVCCPTLEGVMLGCCS